MIFNNARFTRIFTSTFLILLVIFIVGRASFASRSDLRYSTYISRELGKIAQSPEDYRFNWENWANISFARNFSELIQDDLTYPFLNRYRGRKFPYPLETFLSRDEALLHSAKHVLDDIPAPQQIVHLPRTKYGMSLEKPVIYPVHHEDPKKDLIRVGMQEYVDLTENIFLDYDFEVPRMEDVTQFYLDKSDFIWKLQDEIKKSPPYAEDSMVDSSTVKDEPKYFGETKVADASEITGHHDLRFYFGFENRAERSRTIHFLMRAWSEFALSYNIPYVIAHGSALGWYWNGLSLPWDIDIDIQLPIQDFHKMALNFNYSLIIPGPNSDNDRAYLLDINPYYVNRDKKNGNNVIDARFVDITTGSYIDITALSNNARTETDHFQCRNQHDYSYDEYRELHLTRFEGALVYVPWDISPLLKKQFSNGMKPRYNSWTFNDKMRLWVNKKKTCPSSSKFPEEECYEKISLPAGQCRDDLKSCDLIDIEEYESTAAYTAKHTEERKLWRKFMEKNQDTQSLIDNRYNLLELFRYEVPVLHRTPSNTKTIDV